MSEPAVDGEGPVTLTLDALMTAYEALNIIRAERDALKAENETLREALAGLIEAQDHLDYHAVDVRTAETDEERARMLGPFLDCLVGLETSMTKARAALNATVVAPAEPEVSDA